MLLFGQSASADISLTTSGAAYTQNFNHAFGSGGQSAVGEISSAGWTGAGSGAAGTSNSGWYQDVNTFMQNGSATGGGNVAGIFGPANEGALGIARQAPNAKYIGAKFSNDIGSEITQLDISYTGEQWYKGAAALRETLQFEYSLNATSLTTGLWTAVSSLDFTAPTTATAQFSNTDGNNATFRVAGIAGSITGLSILDSETFFIRWGGSVTANNGDGLAVDDFSLTATAVPEPGSLFVLGLVGSIAAVRRRRK